MLYARWLAFLGDQAYGILMRFNIVVNAVRRRFRLPYWSLSNYMKKRVKNAVQYVGNFAVMVLISAPRHGWLVVESTPFFHWMNCGLWQEWVPGVPAHP